MEVSFSAPSAAIAMAGLRATVTAYADVTKTSMANQAKTIYNQISSAIHAQSARIETLQNSSDPTAASQLAQLLQSRASNQQRAYQVAGEAAAPGSGVVQALLPADGARRASRRRCG